MRKIVALVAGVAILAFVNFGIYQRELLVTRGQIVLLKLAPVDPRSLMQGDYMRLRFDVADAAFPGSRWGRVAGDRPAWRDGHIVVAVDGNRVAHFRRLADARPLGPGEVALRYRVRDGQPNFATNAFFFEEGQAKTYEVAQYGEFRVAPDGEMILTSLRDERLQPLEPRR